MTVAQKLLTAEEFYLLPDHEDMELIDGKVNPIMPPNPIHGLIAAELTTQLKLWVKQTNSGIVGTDGGFILGRNPDRVRGPDVWFIRSERVPEFLESFWEIAPDMIAEVISYSDTASVVKEKLQDYFGAGTKLVWLLYPRFKQVEAHTPDGTMKIFNADDRLESNLLPGFSCTVADIFITNQ
ncbi:MAG: Uma2 family endonuclease [Trueperaceae bacterium]